LKSQIFDYYVLFPSHHDGLLLHKKLKEAGVKCTIAPTPRELSSFCGMSLMVSEENFDAVQQVIEECHARIDGIARIPRKNGGWKSC
jgi:hypothetical protein